MAEKVIIRGDSYAKSRPLFKFQMRDANGNPIDLKGYTVRATLRKQIVEPTDDPADKGAAWMGTLVVSSSGVPLYSKGVVLTGLPVEGSIELHMTSEMSRLVPLGVELMGDVELTDPNGEKFTYFINDTVVARDGVTHRNEAERIWINEYEVLVPEKWLPVSESFEGKTINGETFTAESEGPVNFVHDKWLISEETINLMPNPIASLIRHGNNPYASLTTERITSADLTHPTAGRINTATRVTATGTNDGMIGLGSSISSMAVGKTFTVGMWVKVSKEFIGKSVAFLILEYGGPSAGRYAPSRLYTATGSWQYIENSITIKDEQRNSIYVYFNPAGKVAGAWIEYTAVQFEEKPYSTSFTHGDMGEGYSWAGTPHNSPSIRQPASLSIPQTTPPKSAAFKYSEDGENYQIGYIDFTKSPMESDAEPTLLLSPEGSRNRNGSVAPTLTGGVIEVDGKYGKAWQIAEATTNINKYPTWQVLPPSNAGQTITLDTTNKYNDQNTMKAEIHTVNGNTAMVFAAVGPVAEGDVYTVSFKTKRLNGNPTFTPYLYLIDGQGLTGMSAMTFTKDDWETHTITFLPLTAASSSVDFRLYHSGPMTSGSSFSLAELQIEKKAYATPYADGSLGAGHAWTGTPHASASTRAKATAYATHAMPPDQGSLLIRYKMDNLTSGSASGETGQYVGGFGSIGSTAQRGLLVRVHSDGAMTTRQSQTNRNVVDGIPDLLSHRCVYLEYKGDVVAADYRDGVGKRYAEREGSTPMPPTFVSDRISIGGNGHLGPYDRWLNGYVESILVFDRILSEGEVERITSLEGAWSLENSTGYKHIGKVGNVGHAYWVDGKIKIEPHKPMHIGPIMHFDRPLTEAEQGELETIVNRYENGQFAYF